MTPVNQSLRERYVDHVRKGRRIRARWLARRLGLTRAEVRAHFRGVQEWDDSAPPAEFDRFATFAPGTFDPRVLHQAAWWVDILRRPHRIADRDAFTDEHLVAVIRTLRREAWRWAPMPDLDIEAALDLGPAAIVVEVRHAYTEAMERTVLMRALRAEAARRRIGVGA